MIFRVEVAVKILGFIGWRSGLFADGLIVRALGERVFWWVEGVWG